MFVFGATLAVDTFFFLAGFLMSYLMLKDLDKNKGRTQILFGYLHRYIRYLFLIVKVVYIYELPPLQKLPHWYIVGSLSDPEVVLG